MTSAPSQSLRKRLERLEALVSRYESILANHQGRPTQDVYARDVRLAITVDYNYPDPAGEGVPKFPVKFLDATFTQSPGWEELTTQLRGSPTANYDQIAASITGQWIPPGSIVMALWQRAPSAIAGDDGGEWFCEPYGGLVLMSPIECFHPYPSTPTPMYLWELDACEWVITSQVVAAVDPNDTNMLLPGETQWAHRRAGCMVDVAIAGELQTVPLYDLVGSRGLYRRVKPTADIACGTSGLAKIWEVDSCAYASERECEINLCNDWGPRQCVKADTKIEARYLKRGIWVPVQNRNLIYRATLTEAMCPDAQDATVSISGAEGFDFCEESEDLALLVEAENETNHAGYVGDTVYMVRDNTSCDGKLYVFDVTRLCRTVAVAQNGACEGEQFIRQDCAEIKGTLQQKVALETCVPDTIEEVQIALEPLDVVDDVTLGQSSCTIGLTAGFASFYGFSSCGGVPQDSTSIITFTPVEVFDSATVINCEGQNTPTLRFFTSQALQLSGCGGQGSTFDIPLSGTTVIDECLRVGCDANGSEALEAHFSTVYGFCSRPIGWEACIEVVRCDDTTCAPQVPDPPPPTSPTEEEPAPPIEPPPGGPLD